MEKEYDELYLRFLNGDIKAFEQIVLDNKNNLIYFINTLVKNIDISEELSQDVFVYILENRNKYRLNNSLKTYLYIIAKSKALNYLKRSNRFRNVDLNEIKDSDESFEEKMFSKDKIIEIVKVVDSMENDYRIVIFLADFEKLSYREIAKIMNTNEKKIKSLLYRARKKLKDNLEKEGITYEG